MRPYDLIARNRIVGNRIKKKELGEQNVIITSVPLIEQRRGVGFL